MIKQLFLLALVALLMLEVSFALTKYGDAEVKKGQLTIVRDGKINHFDESNGKIPVLKNDILRVGRNSYVLLNTVENTQIKMGSNAVFQIKPWIQRQKIGYLRMLYGKILFKTKELVKKKRKFRMRTATATIGVKGTEGEVEVTANANVQIMSLEGEPFMVSNLGQQLVIPVNQVSFSIGGQEVTIPIAAAMVGSKSPETGGLDRVPPTSSASGELVNPQGPLSAGVTPNLLNNSKKEKVDAGEAFSPVAFKKPQDDGGDEMDEDFNQDLEESESIDVETLAATLSERSTDSSETPKLPSLDDIKDKALQQSLIRVGKMKPIFN